SFEQAFNDEGDAKKEVEAETEQLLMLLSDTGTQICRVQSWKPRVVQECVLWYCSNSDGNAIVW
ncbi:5109_t:CDS:2, partial [Entrophospora sp. SA101]